MSQMTPTYSNPDRVRYECCPLCGSPDLSVLRDQDWTWRWDYNRRLHPVIRWMSCPSCHHQFTWGHHTEEALDVLFTHAQAGQTAQGMTGADIEAARLVWAKVVDAVTPHCSNGNWLDVGAGSGMLAAVADECGFNVVTMEARAQVAAALHARGLQVLAQDVTELKDGQPGRFDVISMCDVLEHVPFPLAALDAVVHALRDGGALFISCPNTDSLAWRTLDGEGVNPYWAEIEHYHNFSFRRLRTLLLQYGLVPVSCSISNRYRVCMDVVARKQSGAATPPGRGLPR
jgi:protein O-GlcNAc transferase